MARHTFTNNQDKAMQFGMHIALAKDGSASMTRGEHALAAGERGLYLVITVPQKIFETPSLRAEISIPEPAAKPEINVGEAESALREALGVDVVITVNPAEKG